MALLGHLAPQKLGFCLPLCHHKRCGQHSEICLRLILSAASAKPISCCGTRLISIWSFSVSISASARHWRAAKTLQFKVAPPYTSVHLRDVKAIEWSILFTWVMHQWIKPAHMGSWLTVPAYANNVSDGCPRANRLLFIAKARHCRPSNFQSKQGHSQCVPCASSDRTAWLPELFQVRVCLKVSALPMDPSETCQALSGQLG